MTNELRPRAIRREARETLRGRWGCSALLVLVCMLVNLGVSMTAHISAAVCWALYLQVNTVLAICVYWTVLAFVCKWKISSGVFGFPDGNVGRDEGGIKTWK